MFSWQLEDELALLFLQPDMASELFRLCQRNRDYLSQWLPWVPHIQQPADSATFIRHAIEKLSCLRPFSSKVALTAFTFTDGK